MQSSGFATRHGLLKALSREGGAPLDALLAAPEAGIARLPGAAA
ncbi:hypothetical protein [Blastococcus sp. SYSU DS0828]